MSHCYRRYQDNVGDRDTEKHDGDSNCFIIGSSVGHLAAFLLLEEKFDDCQRSRGE